MEPRLKQLREIMKQLPHVMLQVDSDEPDVNWNKEGCPHIWVPVEQEDNYTVYFDKGYGGIALFDGNKLLGTGKECIITEDVVVLDRQYYDATKWIWK